MFTTAGTRSGRKRIPLGTVPIGGWIAYPGATAPPGWLFCYGQNISRATYAALFALIGTTFGAGDGTTTFTMPDCRGRFIAGKDNMGGVAANRLTNPGTTSGGISGTAVGNVGGEQTHQITTAELAAHTHTGGVSSASKDGGSTGSNVGTNTSTGSSGSDTAHNNVPPAIIGNIIMYVGGP